MAERQMYKIYDEHDLLFGEHMLSPDVCAVLGLPRISEVSRYANTGIRLNGKFLIVRENVLTTKEYPTHSVNSTFAREWDLVTSVLRNRLEWCTENEGGKKLLVRPRSSDKRFKTIFDEKDIAEEQIKRELVL